MKVRNLSKFFFTNFTDIQIFRIIAENLETNKA